MPRHLWSCKCEQCIPQQPRNVLVHPLVLLSTMVNRSTCPGQRGGQTWAFFHRRRVLDVIDFSSQQDMLCRRCTVILKVENGFVRFSCLKDSSFRGRSSRMELNFWCCPRILGEEIKLRSRGCWVARVASFDWRI